LPTSACTWIKYGAADNQAACKATEASLIATLTGTSGATTAMIEYLKYDTISMTCMPLYKDSATCMANPKCTYYPVAESCGASINFLISNLDAAGCGTEATSMATKYGTTVATANAASPPAPRASPPAPSSSPRSSRRSPSSRDRQNHKNSTPSRAPPRFFVWTDSLSFCPTEILFFFFFIRISDCNASHPETL